MKLRPWMEQTLLMIRLARMAFFLLGRVSAHRKDAKEGFHQGAGGLRAPRDLLFDPVAPLIAQQSRLL